jgi:LysM repeat protein
MPPQRARSPARLLAPAALGLFAVAVVLVVVSSGGGDDEGAREANTAVEGPATTTAPAAGGRPSRRSTYRVKRGDTLGAIAEKTGVEVERLQELNPQLDPQALIAGQKIKLRE